MNWYGIKLMILFLMTHIWSSQGCHWTFVKITENLGVRAVSQKMNTKRDKVQKEKDEIGENREY